LTVAFVVKPTPAAAEQIRAEARWWKANRAKAPRLFRDGIHRAFRLLARYPEAGTVADDVELAGVRRVLLVMTQHYLYYRINTLEKRVEVLAVWSTQRGTPPVLGAEGP
jgi:plasmid stabilization system protein ParE